MTLMKAGWIRHTATAMLVAAQPACVSIPEEAERLAALRAESLSPQYRIALLSTGLMPLFLPTEGLVTQFVDDVGAGFADRLNAAVESWGSPYTLPTLGGSLLTDRLQINEYSRAQHTAMTGDGYSAVLTVTLQLVAGEVATAKRLEGSYRSSRLVQVYEVRAYVSLRSLPADKLLYYGSDVQEPCKLYYGAITSGDSLIAPLPDDQSDSKQAFDRELSACVSRLAGKMLDKLDTTLKRSARPDT